MLGEQVTSLSNKIRAASVWSLFGQLSLNGLRLASFLVAPLFLKPSDYGVFGYALLLVMLFQLIVETAVPMAVVQSRRENSEVVATALCANILLAVLCYLLLCLLSIPAARILGDARVTPLAPLMGTQLLFGSVSSVLMAQMQREMNFRGLFLVRLLGTLPSVAITIYMAVHGYGYWALVAGWLSGGLFQLISVVFIGRLPTSGGIDKSIFLELMRFSRWVMVDITANWAWEYSGGFFVGIALGVSDLGKFRLADQAIRSLCAILLDPLSPVVFSALSAMHREHRQFGDTVPRMNYVFGTISIPLMGALVLLAYPGAQLLGGKWSGIGRVLALDGVVWGLNYLVQAVPQFLRAIGRPAVVVLIRFPMVAVQFAVLAVAVSHGLTSYLVSKIVLEIVMVFFVSGILYREYKMNLFKQLSRHSRTILVTATAVIVSYCVGLTMIHFDVAARVCMQLTCFGSISFVVALFDENSYARHVVHLARVRLVTTGRSSQS